ncbi:MAG: ribonuclease Z [Bacteroidetes bacterium]|nr:ribonuclease Z [Bacteroidota bacterium]
MNEFEVTVLGCGSATPSLLRNPSAQLLKAAGHFFLIDCGEGTQVQLRKNNIKIQRISHIFISHLHGDHYLGLVGLIQTMHLLGRKNKLTIVGPADLKEIIEIQNKYSETFISFDLEYINTNPKKSEPVWEDEKIQISSFPLRHRIDCTGFLFKEKPHPKSIIKKELEKHRISISEIHKLRLGFDALDENGNRVANEKLTTPGPPQKSYAYCSDTNYFEAIIPFIKKVNLLYHEATFLESELERAKKTHHSTATQAATIAQKAEIKQLLLGHFSARYKHTEPFLLEALPIFENTWIAEEGRSYVVE